MLATTKTSTNAATNTITKAKSIKTIYSGHVKGHCKLN